MQSLVKEDQTVGDKLISFATYDDIDDYFELHNAFDMHISIEDDYVWIEERKDSFADEEDGYDHDEEEE